MARVIAQVLQGAMYWMVIVGDEKHIIIYHDESQARSIAAAINASVKG